MEILKKLKELILNIISDLKSTRERILWATLGIFVWTLSKTQDALVLGLISGWVTIVLAFYFTSKYHEHKKPDVVQSNLNGDRNPDA